MNVYGQLNNIDGKTILSHISDWFEWQPQQIKEKIITGKYDVNIDVIVDSLPNSTWVLSFKKRCVKAQYK